jgi:hypothetical protein
MAFGGVDTGRTYEKDAAIVTGSIRYSGLISMVSAYREQITRFK